MNAVSFAKDRHFWSGPGVVLLAAISLFAALPNVLRTRLSAYELEDSISEYSTAPARSADKVAAAPVAPPRTDAIRQVIRTGSLDLLVKDPREISEKIRGLAEESGGFVVSSELYGGNDNTKGSITIRVPAPKFEEIRAAIRSLGLRVEADKMNAEDVTKQYVDQAARLRNLRAQEAQYLAILKQARTVHDTMEVSDKLNEVRGQIEQQQAEFDALSKQVETVALTISLRAEADTQVFGLHWRPLYQIKLAARQGLLGLGDYAGAMANFLFYVPAILLWLTTILIGAAIGWRILRWAGRWLFVSHPKPA
jgi:hypothetical protein